MVSTLDFGHPRHTFTDEYNNVTIYLSAMHSQLPTTNAPAPARRQEGAKADSSLSRIVIDITLLLLAFGGIFVAVFVVLATLPGPMAQATIKWILALFLVITGLFLFVRYQTQKRQLRITVPMVIVLWILLYNLPSVLLSVEVPVPLFLCSKDAQAVARTISATTILLCRSERYEVEGSWVTYVDLTSDGDHCVPGYVCPEVVRTYWLVDSSGLVHKFYPLPHAFGALVEKHGKECAYFDDRKDQPPHFRRHIVRSENRYYWQLEFRNFQPSEDAPCILDGTLTLFSDNPLRYDDSHLTVTALAKSPEGD